MSEKQIQLELCKKIDELEKSNALRLAACKQAMEYIENDIDYMKTWNILQQAIKQQNQRKMELKYQCLTVGYVFMLTLETLKRQIKILEKKLEISRASQERLCADHRGKQIGNKTGCIACDAEYYMKNA